MCRRQRIHRPSHKLLGRLCPVLSRGQAAVPRGALGWLHLCGHLALLECADWDAAAFLDLNALPLSPLANPGDVNGGATPTAGRTPDRAVDPPGVRGALPQCPAQLIALRGTEVDLVYRAVQAEADRAGRLAAVDVVNEQRLNSLGREAILISSSEGKRAGAALNKLPVSHADPRRVIPAVCNVFARRPGRHRRVHSRGAWHVVTPCLQRGSRLVTPALKRSRDIAEYDRPALS